MQPFHRAPRLVALIVFGAVCLALSHRASAVTPESPEVRAVVKKAFAFLDTSKDERLGARCLVGLAYLKDGADETNHHVAAAVQACKNATRGDPGSIKPEGHSFYSPGIAIIFLCTLDPSKYRIEIEKLLKVLDLNQKEHGGWGYLDKPAGDTSMTQYGVLGNWEASKVGFDISKESVERVSNWLIRTQDQTGFWGYQGNLGEMEDYTKVKLVKQTVIKGGNGLVVAGMGSMYMCADILHLIDPAPEPDPSLPTALKPVKEEGKREALTNAVSAPLVRSALSRGAGWCGNNYEIDPPRFTLYYLYALERYQSMRELVEGIRNPSPSWYNDGYVYLRKTQKADGSWQPKSTTGAAPDTAFGILFLLRSMKKSIERSKNFTGGQLIAGRGLPENLENVKLRGGQIVAAVRAESADELIAALEKPESPILPVLLADPQSLPRLVLHAPTEARQQHLARLRKIASSGGPDARWLAVLALGQSRDLDNVPALLAALDDPDWRVAREAHDALQLCAREVQASPLPDRPNDALRREAVDHWKAWYLSLRPDAELN